eukprot:scaffold106_cov177-Ochromonas_danica.AAC.9
MDDELVLYCYKTRSIRTSDWLRILESIPLETEYYIYRRSYWGENAGRDSISPRKTSTMTLVCVVSGVREICYNEAEDNTDDMVSSLIGGVSQLALKTRVNLLLENNHVKIINKVKPSSCSNDAYQLDDTENEIKR